MTQAAPAGTVTVIPLETVTGPALTALLDEVRV